MTPRHRAVFHDQVKGEILDEEFRLVAQRLAIKRVQHGVPRAVGRRTGALRRRAIAEILHHAAERPLVDPPVLGARKRHAEMLELVNRGGRLAAEIFNGILVAQPVRALHRVIHVPAPVIGPHVAKRSRDPALGCHRVRARRENLRDAGGFQSRLGSAKRRPQARAPGADNDHVKAVVGYGVGILRGHQAPKTILRIA